MVHSERAEAVIVRAATLADAETVFDLVQALLRELGEEGEETGTLQRSSLRIAWTDGQTRHFAFLAELGDGTPVGVATISEAFAFYANGWYGIINEMYVAPGHRSSGAGTRLLDAIAVFGRARGWRRIDVTAPESERWGRTRAFYERNGYAFTGPKLKRLLR